MFADPEDRRSGCADLEIPDDGPVKAHAALLDQPPGFAVVVGHLQTNQQPDQIEPAVGRQVAGLHHTVRQLVRNLPFLIEAAESQFRGGGGFAVMVQGDDGPGQFHFYIARIDRRIGQPAAYGH